MSPAIFPSINPPRRLFAKRLVKRSRTVPFMLAALLVVLTACAPDGAYWSPQQAPKRNDVRWITFEHTVKFGQGTEKPVTGENRRLDAFLSRHDAGRDDQFLIAAASPRSKDADTRLAGRREAAVMSILRDRDLTARLLPRTSSPNNAAADVKIVLGRFVIIPPTCPDWSKPANGDRSNLPSSNFGCATATNLGLMVARPEDLVRGRNPGPADGVTGARKFGVYRNGKQAKSPAITPLIIQSGVGGGAQ